MKAMWNGVLLAESDETIVVESNHYFPRSSIVEELFETCRVREAEYVGLGLAEFEELSIVCVGDDDFAERVEFFGKGFTRECFYILT